MSFSIRTLMAITLAAALLLAALHFLPAPVTSLALLTPFLLLMAWITNLCFQRKWKRFSLPLLVLPITLYAFYLGMLGPIAAWSDIGEKKSQLTNGRTRILNVLYTPQSVCAPITILDENLDSTLTHKFIVFMQNYQTAWEEAVENM